MTCLLQERAVMLMQWKNCLQLMLMLGSKTEAMRRPSCGLPMEAQRPLMSAAFTSFSSQRRR